MSVFKPVGNLVIINEDGTETVVGQPVPGSLQIVLNGKLMSEGVDYKVDYLTGSINLVGSVECEGTMQVYFPSGVGRSSFARKLKTKQVKKPWYRRGRY